MNVRVTQNKTGAHHRILMPKFLLEVMCGLILLFLPSISAAQQDGTPEAVVIGSSLNSVVFDGHVSDFEYGEGSQTILFMAGHGKVTAFVRKDEEFLYFAFRIPDHTPHPGDDIVVMLDVGNHRAEQPDERCVRAYVRRKFENSRMHKGDGATWADVYGKWEYKSSLYDQGWEVETRIPLTALGALPGQEKVMGFAFRIWDNKPLNRWNWPVHSDENKPATWGTLVIVTDQ